MNNRLNVVNVINTVQENNYVRVYLQNNKSY
jgi:hypothetical protein